MDLPDTVPPRIADYLTEQPDTGCWTWGRAHSTAGYACVWWNGSQRSLHRVLYELIVGPVPPGLVLDHIMCENKRCANPDHLIPTTNEKNLVRERVEKETCKHGHNDWKVVTRPSGRTGRKCNECGRQDAKRRQRRKLGIPQDWPTGKHYNRRT